MEELIALIGKTYGLMGLIMLSPFVAVVFLWKHNLTLQKQLEKVHEQRTEDAKAITETLLKLVGEQSALNKETNMALERVGDMLAFLPNSNNNR